MNFQALMKTLDRQILEEPGNRRDALRSAGKIGAGVAMASVPAVFAGLMKSRPAFAQQNGQPTPTEVLEFALTLEYLEHDFYERGLAIDGLIPTEDRQMFQVFRDHELAHVRFLEDQLGLSKDERRPNFDFSAGGIFPWATDYPTFRALAQGFEDTGVRAYKGQAVNLIGAGGGLFLTVALQIHSVEARHASVIRRRNGDREEQAPQKGWITDRDPGVVPARVNDTPVGEAIYGPGDPEEDFPAEDNFVQAGVDLRTLTFNPPLENESKINEAFDEPLDMDTVVAIASLFIADE